MPVSPPSPQDSGARPISFVLRDNSAVNSAVTLYIRPEDLTRTDSSRINPQQTLGGTIWADNFGPGMPTINIAGHTGWRRPSDPSAPNSANDGVDRFLQLKNVVFTNWHAQRQIAITSGKDPDTAIHLEFVDHLDQFACVVAPMSYVLRRSRSRPLLMQYQLSMIVTSDQVTTDTTLPPDPVLTSAQKMAIATSSISGSINTLTSAINAVRSFIDNSIATPIAAFLEKTSAVFTAVNAVGLVTDSLVAVARLTAQCGQNIFRSLAAISGLPNLVRQQIMQVAAAFSNVLCVIENVLTPPRTYPDYDPLYGSSNCSSTSGGRAASAFIGLNPFQYTNPQQTPDAAVATTKAQTVMSQLAATDVVRSPPTLAQCGSIAAVVAAGILISTTPASVTTAAASTTSTTGTTTYTGPAWATGPQGPAGPAGAPGASGTNTLVAFEQVATAPGAQTLTLPHSVATGGGYFLNINGVGQSVTGYTVSGATLSLPTALNIAAGDLIQFAFYPLT
jgi:exosortase/archaeosortase